MKALIICNNYPSSADPKNGPFIAEQVKWLKINGIESIVVKPVSFNITKSMVIPSNSMKKGWENWLIGLSTDPEGIVNDQKVYYPKYIGLPNALFTWSSGKILYFQTKNLFRYVFDHYKPDIIHSHFITPNAYIGDILSKKYRVPHITSVMGSDSFHYGLIGGGRIVTTRIMKQIEGIIVKSNSLKQIMQQEYDINPDKIRVIFNGVDLEKFSPNYNKIRSYKSHLLFIGSFIKRKDVLGNLLPALNYMREFRQDFIIHLIGDGAQERTIREKVSKLNLENHIQLHGRLHHSQLKQFFDIANVLVLPSVREGTPNVVMESIASGVPVVACAVDGVPDIVDENSGILVPPRKPKKLAEAINLAFDRQWDIHKIRKFAESHLDIRKKVTEIIDFYHDIIESYKN